MAAGDLTDTLVDVLQIRMENPEGDKFTDAMCLDALNYAQKKAALFLHDKYLSELEVLTSAGAATASVKAFPSGAGNAPLNGAEGILEVYSVTNTGYLKRNRVEEMKRLENTYLAGSTTNLTYYLFDEKIYISTDTAADSLQEYILITPVEMTTTVDPVLNASLYDIILKFAEAILWTASDKLKRRVSAYQDALNQIKRLNDLAYKTRAEGIGTAKQ